MLRLFTDTDTDITPEVAAEYGYSLISMPYAIDGKLVFPYEDFRIFDDHAFYDKLRGGVLPTTSALGEEKYAEIFEPVFAAGDDILYVHFSEAMTATFDGMRRALDKLYVKYPGRKLTEIDTRGITLLSYASVREIGEMAKKGLLLEEIVERAKKICDEWAVYFFADDLRFFKRSGRVGGLAATMGTLLGVRPIIYISKEGKMESIGKERGRQKALEKLVEYVKTLGDDAGSHRIYVGHTDAPEVAGQLEEMLRGLLGKEIDIERVPVNPTAGSHCGPDTVGVCFHAVHR